MNILTFDKYKFIKDNFEYLKEDSQFMQMDIGSHGLGAGYGFAVDPQMSMSSGEDSPYRDNFARTAQMVNDLSRVIRNVQGQIVSTLSRNYFVEDVDDYTDLTILRIFMNTSMKLDVYISFVFKGEEFFGVFKNFNGNNNNQAHFKSDLFSSVEYGYIDREYYLKLCSYLRKILSNWFIPDRGLYVNQKPNAPMKGEMGEIFNLKENAVVEVIGYNIDKDNDPYIIVKYDDKAYNIVKNNYYFFKYWFEPT